MIVFYWVVIYSHMTVDNCWCVQWQP